MDDAANSFADHVWQRRTDLLYQIRLSSLYHQKHARFFDLMEKLVKASGIAGGSVAFAKAADPDWVMWFSALVAISAAVSLVFSFGERSRKHGQLAVDFKMLEAKVVAAGEAPDTAQVDLWFAEMLSSEAGETASLGALVRICQNELLGIDGGKKRPLTFLQRWTAHFVDWSLDIKS